MTAVRPGLDGTPVKQNANGGCSSCASLAGLALFYCMFYFTCDRSLTKKYTNKLNTSTVLLHKFQKFTWGGLSQPNLG